MSLLSGLIIETELDYRVVKFCGINLARFNVISDDYAYTHADDWAKSFAKSWHENDRLPMDARVETASAYAHANLDDSWLSRKDSE